MAALRLAILMLNEGRGSGEIARQHSRELIDRGHQIAFIHPRMGAGVPGADNSDVPLHQQVLPVHEYLPGVGANQKVVSEMDAAEAMAFVADYEAALEKTAPSSDLMVGYHGDLAAIAAHRVASRQEKPFVLFLHGTGVEPRRLGRFANAVWDEVATAIRAADGLIVTTEYVRDELVRPLVEVPADRFLVLPCGVDTERFRPDGAGNIHAQYQLPPRYVIAPGPLIHSKGPHNVVAASGQFADIAPTIFIGDGELRSELELNLGRRGRFLGFVPDEDKTKLINAATILTAAPEKKEHFGIIYIEALAAGTVPVAYEGGGVDSILRPDVGVRTRRDPSSLGRAIRDLLRDNDRRNLMAANGRRRALAEYRPVALVGRLEEWLQGIIDRRS